MTRLYTPKAQTRRWPVHVFFNILNIVIINSWVLFKDVNKSKISRRDFIIKLVEELSETTKVSRNSQKSSSNSQPTTPKTPLTRNRVASFDLNVDSTPSKIMDTKKDKKNCQIRFCNQNKTNVTCISCNPFFLSPLSSYY